MLLDLDLGAARAKLSAHADVSVTSVESVAEAVRRLPTVQPAVIVAALLDLHPSDVQPLKDLVRGAAAVPVLIISNPVAEERALMLIKAGAAGYLFTQDTRYLTTSVRELVRGGVPMSAAISRLVLQRARRSSAKMAAVRLEQPTTKIELLTERQREILALLQHGHSYDDIGTALGLSVNTVRSHVRALYERLGVATKVEAVMIGLELGIIERTRLSERPSSPT